MHKKSFCTDICMGLLGKEFEKKINAFFNKRISLKFVLGSFFAGLGTKGFSRHLKFQSKV